jgi:hypothetical protein
MGKYVKKGGNGGVRPGAGRPFVPNEEQRNAVGLYVALGRPYDLICQLMIHPATGKPIDKNTFMKVFAQEIAQAQARLDLVVATSFGAKLRAGDNFALARYMHNRWGWDKQKHEQSAPDGQPIEHEREIVVRFIKPPPRDD